MRIRQLRAQNPQNPRRINTILQRTERRQDRGDPKRGSTSPASLSAASRRSVRTYAAQPTPQRGGIRRFAPLFPLRTMRVLLLLFLSRALAANPWQLARVARLRGAGDYGTVSVRRTSGPQRRPNALSAAQRRRMARAGRGTSILAHRATGTCPKPLERAPEGPSQMRSMATRRPPLWRPSWRPRTAKCSCAWELQSRASCLASC
eukprot:scaffold3675_cov212-Pinguiococcus_pyrenoidosus.AAC.2